MALQQKLIFFYAAQARNIQTKLHMISLCLKVNNLAPGRFVTGRFVTGRFVTSWSKKRTFRHRTFRHLYTKVDVSSPFPAVSQN